MVNIYLLIELLGAANSANTLATLQDLQLANCKLNSVAALSDEKLVAQLDCNSYPDATKAILDNIAPIEGIVQTNVMAAVRPVHR
jgi:hypothetical protein